MVDTTTAQLFWYKIKQWCANMADRVNEYVYTDESKETVDIVNLLLLGWILFGLVVYILGNVIATQLKKRKAKKFAGPVPAESEEQLGGEESIVPTKAPLSTESGISKVADAGGILFAGAPPKPLLVPVCSGEDTDLVDWINSVFSWIYNQRVVTPVLDSLLSAINARTRLSSAEHGVLVDFHSVVHNNEPPVITEAVESIGSNDKVNLTCHAEILKLVFEVIVTQVKDNEKNVYKVLLKLNRLAGQLNIECDADNSVFTSQFPESPQIELEIAESSVPPEKSESIHNLICEIATDAFTTAVVQQPFSSYSDFPKFSDAQSAVKDDMDEAVQKEKKERLLVKIVKASNLGTKQGSTRPYCVIEMDEPPQRFETTPVDDAASPFWDESFIFVVKDTSAELLFEIYDKNCPVNENFLGLCIVSVEELVKNPSQRQIIPLQSRPLEKDSVSGTLTAEFLFMDRDIPTPEATQLGQAQVKSDGGSGQVVETNSRVTAGGTIITTTTIKRTAEGDTGKEPEPKENVQKTRNTDRLSLSDSRQKFLKELIDENSFDSLEFDYQNYEYDNDDSLINKNKIKNKNDSEQPADPLLMQGENDVLEKQIAYSVETGSHTAHGRSEESPESGQPAIANGHVLLKTADDSEHDKVSSKELHDIKDHIVSASNACDNDDEKGNLHVPANDIANMESNGLNLPLSAIQDGDLCSSSTTLVAQNQNDAEEITETALKELEKAGKPGAPNKSMLIIHSVQRELVQPNMKVKLDKSGKWQEVAEAGNSGSESLEASPATHPSLDSQSSFTESVPSSPSHLRNGVDRSRPKEKKSLIGNLRKKLSFRKPRSRSMEAQERLNASPVPGAGNNRSISSERMKVPQGAHDSSSLRSGRKRLAILGSSRSSFSEASGVSTASSRTYINENSTLVIEINENGITKRYLIPTSMIHRSKWKKKGVKLHLYNDHVFVAKHLSGTTQCQVCKKHLTRRPGKQGYECRDCNLQCHKSCHVKVPEYCPNSSVTSMEVEYIHDPRLAKPKSV